MAPMAASFIAPMASSLINSISGKGIVRLRKGREGGFLPLLASPLIMKVLGKEMQYQEEDIIIWIIWTNVLNIIAISVTSLSLMVYFQQILYLR